MGGGEKEGRSSGFRARPCKTLTCVHAVVHLVVTGLAIFTQVARGWGFWEPGGKWFIKRPARLGEKPFANSSHTHTPMP